MDVNDWIESGILESYLMGYATEAERKEVEEMARIYPIVKEELTSLELFFENLGRIESVTPPLSVKDQIEKRLFEDIITEEPVQHAPKLTVTKSPRILNLYRLAAVSLGILFLGSLGMNLYMANQMHDMKVGLTEMSHKEDTLSHLAFLNKHYKDSLAHQLFMAYNPHMKMVHLTGMPMEPNGHVMVYWDMDTKDVYVHIDQLPAPQPGMQYQLWAFKGGKPVNAGMITDGDMLKLKSIDGNVEAFAVTLEKAGGSNTPTMNSMYVMGKV